MNKPLSILLLAILIVSGCATGGQKYVDLAYTGTSDASRSGKIGISVFTDNRANTGTGYVGTRYLNKKSKETYSAFGDDLALSVTGICKSYLQDTGFECTSIRKWEFSPEGAKAAGQRFDYLVGGEIISLECFAMKKIGFTSMTIDIELVLYVGDPGRAEIKRTSKKLKLERNEITFSKEKLEKFLNESLLEVIQGALSSSIMNS
jgi:hypothetical protein